MEKRRKQGSSTFEEWVIDKELYLQYAISNPRLDCSPGHNAICIAGSGRDQHWDLPIHAIHCQLFCDHRGCWDIALWTEGDRVFAG